MKIHLPVSLRKALLSVLAVVSTAATADASVMHSEVSLMTYTDFGQNMGRYAVGNTNALLNYIRQQEGGVYITYTGGDHAAFLLPHGMIDFSSQSDSGYGTSVGYNAFATVEHNGVFNGTFSQGYLPEGGAIYYSGVEYRYSNKFNLTPGTDYKLTRLSKLVTDVAPATVYGQTDRNWDACNNLTFTGQLLYRAGSGIMGGSHTDGSTYNLAGPYVYITGGIDVVENHRMVDNASGTLATRHYINFGTEGVSPQHPMPFVARGGDSGSPEWIWNERTGQFEFLVSVEAAGNRTTESFGAPEWTVGKLESFDKNVTLNEGVVAHIYSASESTGQTITDEQGRVAKPFRGYVKDGSGSVLTSYIGVKSGINTWNNLDSIKNTDNWYAYGADFFNCTDGNASTSSAYVYADMMQTENLVFTAQSAHTSLVVEEDTDLGIGYVRLAKADSLAHADYTISGGKMLNSAGYVVDSGVDAHLQLTSSAGYTREWRAVVAEDATLHIDGSGDTNALLNVGGAGKVVLNRDGGYAAYNVLASNGITVGIGNTEQVYRDFTFGFRGGVLDMNGNSMAWDNGKATGTAGFTIHALDEQAIVANLKADSSTTLTWIQGGAQTWLGSFQDTAESALKFVYNGGGVLTMNSIHTRLQNSDSGIEVQNGTLKLVGTNTVHGKGSLNGLSAERYSHADDWHYADAAANVTVKDGATFELGSHARLTGNVTVEQGGALVVREGVKSRLEYIEGGQVLEDTYGIRDFYGLKGDIVNNGTLCFDYAEGTSSVNTYAGNIGGSGSMSIDLGMDGAMLVLSGTNTMGGTRSIASGAVLLQGAGALGSATGAQAWEIGERGWLAVEGVGQASVINHVHADSSGALALAADTATQLDMGGHGRLFLGAQAGRSVQYGAAGTEEELAAWNGEAGRNRWLLGGGGGELVVNWRLRGDNDLVLGNEYMGGTVTLANTANDFSGNIILTKGGNVVLDYTEAAALGQSHVQLQYGNAVSGSNDVAAMLGSSRFAADVDGILLLDRNTGAQVDLASHRQLHLGAKGDSVVFNGGISVDPGGVYRFGGPGQLILQTALADNGANDMVVDGQGFAGGAVVLAQAADIRGQVTVRGYDAARSAETGISSGSMALVLAADNALEQASSVQVDHGGLLGVAASSAQHVAALALGGGGSVEMGDGSRLVADSLQMAEGSCLYGYTPDTTLQVKGGTLSGTIDVGAIVMDGAGSTLTVSGANTMSFNSFDLKAGTLELGGDMNASGLVNLHGGAQVKLNGHTMRASIGALADATLNSTAGSTMRGSLDALAGVTLSISGNDFSLQGANEHLTSGGKLDFSGLSTLRLGVEGNNAQTFGGTVRLGNTTLNNVSTDTNMTYEFNKLEVDGAAKLQQSGGNTLWNIHHLSGSGSLTWNSGASHNTNSVLTLDGDGDFAGEIVFDRAVGNSSMRRYQAFMVLESDKAAQNAAIRLTGGGINDFSALLLDTDAAHMKGLVSDTAGKNYSMVYATKAFTSPWSSPTTDRKASLVLTGEDNYMYRGGVNGSADCAIDLIKAGTGTQTFADGNSCDGEASLGTTTASFGNVSVLGGKLVLGNTHVNVYGDYAIAQGATLSYTSFNTIMMLGAGQTLAVLATEGSHAAATLEDTFLVLQEGSSLSFSGAAMQQMGSSSYLLNVTKSVMKTGMANEIRVGFTDVNMLEDGVAYKLIDNTNIANLVNSGVQFKASGLDYFDAAFAADEVGLSVTFSLKDGGIIWTGTDADHTWSGSDFGGKEIHPTLTQFIFTDAAQNRDVKVTENSSLDTAMFDAAGDYRISSDNASTVQFSTLGKRGSGDVELVSGLSVTTATHLDEGRLLLHGNALHGTIDGGGTLVLAAADASLDGLGGTIGTLEISNGLHYTVTADDAVKAHTYDANGATLSVADSTGVEAVTLRDHAALVLGKYASVDNLHVVSDSTLDVACTGSNEYAKLTAADSVGEAVLTKTGAGRLELHGNGTVRRMEIAGGTVMLSNQVGITTLEQLRIGSGACLSLDWNTSLTGAAINMEDGSQILLTNGAGGKYELTADISIDGTARITGSKNGNNTQVKGSISGNGVVNLDRGSNANTWKVYSAISDGSDSGGTLAMRVDKGTNVHLYGANSYSGGTVIDNAGGTVTVGSTSALGFGAVEMLNGTLELASHLAVSSLSGTGGTVRADASPRTLAITGESGEFSFSGSVSGVSLVKSGAGSQTLANVSGLKNVSVLGGSLKFTQTLAVENGNNVLVYDGATLEASELQSNGGTISIAGGQTTLAGLLSLRGGITNVTGGRVDAARMIMVDSGKGDSTLNIAGGDISLSSSVQDTLYVACWNNNTTTGTINLTSGSLRAENAVMRLSAYAKAQGIVHVDGGELSVKGIDFKLVGDNNHRGVMTLGNATSGDATVSIGSEGIKGVQGGDAVLTLGNGTIKATADWTMGKDSTSADLADVNLVAVSNAEGKSVGTVFDTNGHTVQIENKLTGDGSLVKDGAGTLLLKGGNDYTGDTTVKKGTLALDASATLANGSVALAANGAQGSLQRAVLSGSTLSGLDGEGQAEALKVLYQNAKFTVNDMVLSADTTIGKPAVATSGASVGTVTELGMNNSTVILEKGVNTSLSTSTLTAPLVLNADVTLAAGESLSSLTCTSFSVDVLSGNFTLDLSRIWAELNAGYGSYLAVVFEGVERLDNDIIIEISLPNVGYWSGIAYNYVPESGGPVAYFLIPEPATATLSLLTLAALAARRRRR